MAEKNTNGVAIEDLAQCARIGLARLGASGAEQDRFAPEIARVIHEKYRGRQVYFHRGRKPSGLSFDDRRRIFMDWHLNRTADEIILERENISIVTLRKIRAEGRKNKWGR